jgi:hypothetical protein
VVASTLEELSRKEKKEALFSSQGAARLGARRQPSSPLLQEDLCFFSCF